MADGECSPNSLATVISQLKANRRLERDKGLAELKSLLQSDGLSSSELEDVESSLACSLMSTDCCWEELHGATLAASVLVCQNKAKQDFVVKLRTFLPALMDHEQSRVRNAAGELVGNLCRCQGVDVFLKLEDCIVGGIRDNLERDVLSANAELVEKLVQQESSDGEEERPSSPSAAQIFHDTAGWKNLETYMSALQHVVEGCGSSFASHVTPSLLELLFATLKHTNRFVRETGYKVLAAIITCPGLSQLTIDSLWPTISVQLAEGLADNWSQVRMSASVATRSFFSTKYEFAQNRERFLNTLLPPMCLNRYYVAEGVRLYSQETWRQVVGSKGVELVEEHIQNVVQFYIQESQAANHAVREAACACIAELGSKVSKESLRSYVDSLVGTLLECFRDDSWPVRDAACLACGNFVSCFPNECRQRIDELLPLFLGNLEDSIPSVRQGAASAISSIVTAYGDEMKEKVMNIIRERLPLVKEQPASSSSSSGGIDPRPAVFGVVRRLGDRDGDDDKAHSNQQMYSCGSLAPKMKRGGGCMDSHFHKLAEPWEKSEGCVHLLAELSQVKECNSDVESLLPLLAEACRHKHYAQHHSFAETTVRRIPVMARALGKRVFKRHLELFLDVIFDGVSSDSQQLKVASSDCLIFLSQFLGKMIMRGRVESYNPTYLTLLDSCVSSTGPHAQPVHPSMLAL